MAARDLFIPAAFLLSAFSSLAGCSCSCGTGGSDHPGVFTTHQFLSSPTATAGLGQDCTTGGQSDCISPGICTHYGPNPNATWACSTLCRTSADCPETWGCATLVPGYVGLDGKLCMPPTTWRPALTTVRTPSTEPGGRLPGDGTGTPANQDGGR